jgi:hypothetical protein
VGTRADYVLHGFTHYPGLIPIVAPPQPPRRKTAEEIVEGLLALHQESNDKGMTVITMDKVVQVMGGACREHLEWYQPIRRARLSDSSELLARGATMGIPHLFMQWLGGYRSEQRLVIPSNTLRTQHEKVVMARSS